MNSCVNILHEVLTAIGESDLIHLYNVFNYIFSPVVNFIGFNPLNFLRLIFPDVVLRSVAMAIISYNFMAFNAVVPSMLVISLTMVTLANRKFIQSIKQNYGNISVVII